MSDPVKAVLASVREFHQAETYCREVVRTTPVLFTEDDSVNWENAKMRRDEALESLLQVAGRLPTVVQESLSNC